MLNETNKNASFKANLIASFKAQQDLIQTLILPLLIPVTQSFS